IPRDGRSVGQLIDKIRLAVLQTSRRHAVPSEVQIEKWYTPRTIDALRRIKFAIDDLRGDARLLGDAAFSAILLGVCRETRHWGYVCDNTAPKGDYDRDARKLFLSQISDYQKAFI